jgi:4-hydroxy-tetrahydrodipicolinate synthase
MRGVIPILQTPFLADGAMDLESLRREARYVCECGAAGMAFPGFVSEWWKLGEDEILSAASAIREETRGRALLVLNVTAQSTHGALRQARDFVRIGCDALMCLPPFVVPPGQDDILRHLRRVLEDSGVPFILQYSASLTGLSLDPQQLLELHRQFPQLNCVKVDFVPPGPAITRLRATLPDNVTYLVGFAGLQLADSLLRGASGLMGGAGHLEEDLAAFQALTSGDAGGREAFYSLLPLLNFEMQTVPMSIALHKRLLYERGIIATDHVREPGRSLDRLEIEELHRVVENAAGLLRRTGAPGAARRD